jgi:hypothetical protein
MTQSIRDVLSRRGDLSTFVVHLTRDRDVSGEERGVVRLQMRHVVRHRQSLDREPLSPTREDAASVALRHVASRRTQRRRSERATRVADTAHDGSS